MGACMDAWGELSIGQKMLFALEANPYESFLFLDMETIIYVVGSIL
jgi:hypothetical protein